MRVEVGHHQQERRPGAGAQEFDAASGEKVVAVNAGKRDRLSGRVENGSFVSVGGALQDVGAFPQIEEPAAIFGRDRAEGSGILCLGPKVPFADVVGRVAPGAQDGGERYGVGVNAQTVAPYAVFFFVLAGEEAAAGRRADRMIDGRRTEEHAAAGEGVDVGSEAHGVRAHRAEVVRAELIGNDKDDVRLRAGRRRGLHCREQRGRLQKLASCHNR